MTDRISYQHAQQEAKNHVFGNLKLPDTNLPYPNETVRAVMANEEYERSKMGEIPRMTLDEAAARFNISLAQLKSLRWAWSKIDGDTKRALANGSVRLNKVVEDILSGSLE